MIIWIRRFATVIMLAAVVLPVGEQAQAEQQQRIHPAATIPAWSDRYIMILPGFRVTAPTEPLLSATTCTNGSQQRQDPHAYYAGDFGDLGTQIAPLGSGYHLRYFSYMQRPACPKGSWYYDTDTHEDLGKAAGQLQTQLAAILAADPHATFDLIGHSLGGVVAAYWLVTQASPQMRDLVHSLVTFDSPLAGSTSLESVLGAAQSGPVWSELQPSSAQIGALNDPGKGLLAVALQRPAPAYTLLTPSSDGTTYHNQNLLYTIANSKDRLVPASDALIEHARLSGTISSCPLQAGTSVTALDSLLACHIRVLHDPQARRWAIAAIRTTISGSTANRAPTATRVAGARASGTSTPRALQTPGVVTPANTTLTLQWTAHAGPVIGTVLSKVSCANEHQCVAITNSGDVILLSRDGGLTWSVRRHAPYAQLSGVSCDQGKVCVAVGSDQTGDTQENHLLRSTDNGVTWTFQVLQGLTNANLFAVTCASATLCLAGGSPGILRSTDGFATWTIVTASAQVRALDCPTTQFCVALGSGSTGEVTLVSKDAGLTWSTEPAPRRPITGPQIAVSCAGLSFCMIVAGELGISTSRDEGTTWQSPAYGSRQQVSSDSVSCPRAGTCIVIGAMIGAVSDLWTTMDGGRTWSAQNIDPPIGSDHSLNDIQCLGSGWCIAVGGMVVTTRVH